MAKIKSNRSVENSSEQLVLNTLADGLPDGEKIKPSIQSFQLNTIEREILAATTLSQTLPEVISDNNNKSQANEAGNRVKEVVSVEAESEIRTEAEPKKGTASTLSRFARPLDATTPETIPNPKHTAQPVRRKIFSIGDVVHGVLNISDEIERFTNFRAYRQTNGEPVKQSQLAHAMERELDKRLHHLIKETIAHNNFTVQLSVKDFEHYAPFKQRAELELQEHISQVIKARGYKLEAPVQVKIIEDVALTEGNYQVTSAIDKSIVIENEKAKADGPYLEYAVGGDRFPLDKNLMTLGRSRQNDICVGPFDIKRVVSRKHAVIRLEEDGYVIYDGLEANASTFGTFVNGERLQAGAGCLLKDGQRIILGPTQRFDPHQPLQGSLQLIFHTN